MKQFLGLIITIIYALIIRILAEYNVMEINSFTYLFITPAILGCIPFIFRNDKFYSSVWKAIFFPLMAIIIFLLIAVVAKIEDIFCYLILGLPYITISVIVSVSLYVILKKRDDDVPNKMFSILLLPIILGGIEKEIPKTSTDYTLSESIIINSSVETVYDNLLEVPDLGELTKQGISNYLGVPCPKYSKYDSEANVRKGYFENGIVFYETVEKKVLNSELVFNINIDKSELANSPTLKHVLLSKGLVFDNVSYRLIKLNSQKTKLILSTTFSIHSNLKSYGQFWSKLIITDFEKNILNALKYNLEK